MPPSTPPSTPKRHSHPYSPYTPTHTALPPTPKTGRTKRITSSRVIVDSDSPSPSLASDNNDETLFRDGSERFLEVEKLPDGKVIKPKIYTSPDKGKKNNGKEVKVKAEKTVDSKPKARKSNGPKAAPRAWDGNEDWAMYSHLHPKTSKPDWAEVARQVGNGRDAKSCQNRYAVLSKKVESTIKSQSSST